MRFSFTSHGLHVAAFSLLASCVLPSADEQSSSRVAGAGVLPADPTVTISTDRVHMRLGSYLATGDVDGDGYQDLIVSTNPFGGQLDVHLGSPQGISDKPAATLTAEHGGSYYAPAAVTDVNGDGKGDIVVGASGLDSQDPIVPGTTIDIGGLYVYLGRARSTPTAEDPTGLGALAAAPARIAGDGAHAMLGRSVAAAGDVNHDGYGDVIAETNQRVSLYLGGAQGLSATPASTVTVPNPGYFGRSIASAGDVNGDGCADVLIGEPDLETGGGRAHVFVGQGSRCGDHGTHEGLAATAAWSTPSSGFAGEALAGAGDVNGDGFGDVIVGPDTSGNGAALLYLGSATGLSATPDWAFYDQQPDQGVGRSFAAGDVNGDGLSDVVVGAAGIDPEFHTSTGKFMLFLGVPHDAASRGGLSKSIAWTAPFSGATAAIADFNGDHHGDLALGTPDAGGWQYEFGRVYVYQGSAGQPVTEPPFPTGTVLNGKPFSTDARSFTEFADGGSCRVLHTDFRFNYMATDLPADADVSIHLGVGGSNSRWENVRDIPATHAADGWHAQLTVTPDQGVGTIQFVFHIVKTNPNTGVQTETWDNGGIGATSYYQIEVPTTPCGEQPSYKLVYPSMLY